VIFMRLLSFVAIYGLMLMPIGAVIFAEHWLFPKLALRQYWAEKHKLRVNPHALIAWLTVLVLCFPIEDFTHGVVKSPMELLGVHLYFRWLPGWFVAVLVYTVLCRMTLRAWRSPTEPAVTPLETAAVSPVATTPRPPASMPLPPIAWMGGAVALISLVMCLVLPVMVYLGGTDPASYAKNMANYKIGLMVATVTYFVGGIIWTIQREKARGAAA
jgi:cytosine permease